jgi:hypothetical protein
MVWKMRELAWLMSYDSLDGLVRKVLWISAGLGYDLGSRPGNVTQPDGPKAQDHNTRTGDLVFTVRDDLSYAGRKKIRGGEDLRKYLAAGHHADDDVYLVDIGQPTDKAGRLCSTQRSLVPRPIMRRSPLESQFLTDLCDWMVLAKRDRDQALAGRWYPVLNADKVVTRKELTGLVKESAAAINLPANSFSAKSFRSGNATTMASASGVSDVEVNQRGGWVAGSTVPQKHYISRVQGRGPMAVGGSGYGVKEVERLLPLV